MGWLVLGIALLAITRNISAQNGYNYPTPQQPFEGPRPTQTGGFPSQTTRGPTPRPGGPTTTGGYTSPGFPSTFGPSGNPGSSATPTGQPTRPGGEYEFSGRPGGSYSPATSEITPSGYPSDFGNTSPVDRFPGASNPRGSTSRPSEYSPGGTGQAFPTGYPAAGRPSGPSFSSPTTTVGYPSRPGNSLGYSGQGRPATPTSPTFPGAVTQEQEGYAGGRPSFPQGPNAGFPGAQPTQASDGNQRPTQEGYPSAGRPSGPAFSPIRPQQGGFTQEYPSFQRPGGQGGEYSAPSVSQGGYREPGQRPEESFGRPGSVPAQQAQGGYGKPVGTPGQQGSQPGYGRPQGPSDQQGEPGAYQKPGQRAKEDLDRPGFAPAQQAPGGYGRSAGTPAQQGSQPGYGRSGEPQATNDQPGEQGEYARPGAFQQSQPAPQREYEKPGVRQGGFGGSGQADRNYQEGQGAQGPAQALGRLDGQSQGIKGTAPGFDGSDTSGSGLGGGPGEEENEGDYSAIPGQPDIDYPILSYVPETSFRCDQQEYPGYYADVETRCQVFHICANNKTYDFLCPNGTIFHQEYLVCVWWNQFDCNSAPSLFNINVNIYDYSIMGAQQTGAIPVGGSFPANAAGYQAPQGPNTQPGYNGAPSQGPSGSGYDQISGPGFASQQPGRPSAGQPSPGFEQDQSRFPAGPKSGSSFPTQQPEYSPARQDSRPGYSNGRSSGTGEQNFGQEQPGNSAARPRAPGTEPQQPEYLSNKPQQPGYANGRPAGPDQQSFEQEQQGYSSGAPSGPDFRPQQPFEPNRPGYDRQQERPQSNRYPSQGPGGKTEQTPGVQRPDGGPGYIPPRGAAQNQRQGQNGGQNGYSRGQEKNGYNRGQGRGPEEQEGYPSGSGDVPSYSGTQSGTPGLERRPQQPTREYLPPFGK